MKNSKNKLSLQITAADNLFWEKINYLLKTMYLNKLSIAEPKGNVDWNKLSIQELKDFIDLVDPLSYAKCAAYVLENHLWDKNFQMTIPVQDLCIAANYSGKVPQKYKISQLRQLSGAKLTIFADQFGIPPDRDRVIRILRYLNALEQESTLPYPPVNAG